MTANNRSALLRVRLLLVANKNDQQFLCLRNLVVTLLQPPTARKLKDLNVTNDQLRALLVALTMVRPHHTSFVTNKDSHSNDSKSVALPNLQRLLEVTVVLTTNRRPLPQAILWIATLCRVGGIQLYSHHDPNDFVA